MWTTRSEEIYMKKSLNNGNWQRTKLGMSRRTKIAKCRLRYWCWSVCKLCIQRNYPERDKNLWHPRKPPLLWTVNENMKSNETRESSRVFPPQASNSRFTTVMLFVDEFIVQIFFLSLFECIFHIFISETETSGPVNGGRSEINQYLDSYSIRASKIIFISIFFTTLSMLQSKWRFSHRRVPKFFLLSSFHLDVHNRIFGWQMLQQSWRRELFFIFWKTEVVKYGSGRCHIFLCFWFNDAIWIQFSMTFLSFATCWFAFKETHEPQIEFSPKKSYRSQFSTISH